MDKPASPNSALSPNRPGPKLESLRGMYLNPTEAVVLSKISTQHQPDLSIIRKLCVLISSVCSSGNTPLSLMENHNHLQIKSKYKQMPV